MPRIALTREDGLNDQLEQAVRAHYLKHVSVFDDHIKYEEVPGVEQVRGPDFSRLARLWDKDEYDCCCLLGAEAAKIYCDQCKHVEYGRLLPVGKGTAEVLQRERKANVVNPGEKVTADGTALAEHLPLTMGPRILLLCSVQQKDECKKTLEERGFDVTILQVYSTQPRGEAPAPPESLSQIDIWTFGSTSAVKGVAQWGAVAASIKAAICVNGTTARVAEQLLPDTCVIETAEKSGVKAWAAKVVDFMQKGASAGAKKGAATTASSAAGIVDEAEGAVAGGGDPASSAGVAEKAATTSASAAPQASTSSPGIKKSPASVADRTTKGLSSPKAGSSSSLGLGGAPAGRPRRTFNSSAKPSSADPLARGFTSPGVKKKLDDPLADFLAGTSGSSATKKSHSRIEKGVKFDPLAGLTHATDDPLAKKQEEAGVAANTSTAAAAGAGVQSAAGAAMQNASGAVTTQATAISTASLALGAPTSAVGAAPSGAPTAAAPDSTTASLAPTSAALAAVPTAPSVVPATATVAAPKFPGMPPSVLSSSAAAKPASPNLIGVVDEEIVDDRSRNSSKEQRGPDPEANKGATARPDGTTVASSSSASPGQSRKAAPPAPGPASRTAKDSDKSISDLPTSKGKAGKFGGAAAAAKSGASSSASGASSLAAKAKPRPKPGAGPPRPGTGGSAASAVGAGPAKSGSRVGGTGSTPGAARSASRPGSAAAKAPASKAAGGPGHTSSRPTSGAAARQPGGAAAPGVGGTGATSATASTVEATSSAAPAAAAVPNKPPSWEEVNQLWEVIGKWEASFADLKQLHETEVSELKQRLARDEIGSPAKVARGTSAAGVSAGGGGGEPTFDSVEDATEQFRQLRDEYEQFRKAKFVEIELLHEKLNRGGGGAGGMGSSVAGGAASAAEVSRLRAENAQLAKQLEYFTLYATV